MSTGLLSKFAGCKNIL